jgi:hypothetical protein
MNRRYVLVVIVLLLLLGGAYVATRKLGESEETRRARLLPQVRAAFDALRAELSAVHGIELVLVSTRRTEDEQAAKVAAGLSATNNSWHLLGRALDVQTARPNAAGKFISDPDGKDVASYKTLHQVASRHGFRGVPQGSPFDSKGSKAYIETKNGKVWDVGHLEFPQGMTFAQAKAAADKGLA